MQNQMTDLITSHASSKKPLLFSFFGLIILLILFLPSLINPSMITVSGEGNVEYQPDKVEMIVVRVDSSPVANDAINIGTGKTEELIKTVKDVAGIDSQIKRSFNQVQPVANIQGGIDYQVSNVFAVTFRNPQLVEELVMSLYRAGATTISNVTFGSSQEEELAADAKKEAVADAKKNAKQLAKASGKRLGRLISVAEDDLGVGSSISEDNEEASAFNKVTLTKYVSATYSLW